MRYMPYYKNKKLFVLFSIFLCLFLFGFAYGAKASLMEELKRKIKENTEKIKQIEKEAKKFESKLHEARDKKNTLKSQVKELEHEIYHLNLEIQKTQAEITKTNLNIDLLKEEIKEKEEQIVQLKAQMAYVLQLLYEADKTSFLSILVSAKDFSDALNQKEYLRNLEKQMSLSLAKVNLLKKDLESNKKEQEKRAKELYLLNEKLADQQEITNNKKIEKKQLLKETKNQEYIYQKTLAELNRQRKNIEKETGELEKKLKEAINKSKLPKGKGILKWPLDNIRITQGYGMTPFAKTGAYGGNIHNGLDIAGRTGTPVKSAGDGEIIGVGNNGRYAYGKWIAIKHNNGLVTLYAHLSLQKVKKGQKVKAGELIGYVGATGYVTGPHLHFTVYAPDSFDLYQSSKVSWLWIPVGAPLNPLDYL